MKPTIGRIVLFTLAREGDNDTPTVRAAIITATPALADGETKIEPVWLGVFTTTGSVLPIYAGRAADGIEAGTEAARGLWQWPNQG